MTPTTVQGAIDLFQVAFDGISGIQSAPADPPDNPDAFPFITSYVTGLRTESNTPEDFRALWDIRVDFLVANQGLPAGISSLLTYPETILNAIYATIKTNAIPCGNVTGEYVSLDWGGITCIGLSFIIHEVKILHTIT
jgi:hypothetical protein